MNRQKTRQPHMSKVLETLLIARAGRGRTTLTSLMVHQPGSTTLVALQSVASAIQAGRAWSRCWMRCRCRCVGDFIAITGESGSGKSTLLIYFVDAAFV